MGKALQVVTGYVASSTGTNTFDAVTVAPNDSLAVNDYVQGSDAWLINAWLTAGHACVGRIRSPNFHDDVNGMQFTAAANSPIPLMDGHSKQRLIKNDTLTVEIANGTASDLEDFTMLHYYENLPGANASLYRWSEIENSIAELMTCKVTCTAAGTDGAYEGSATMVSVQNLFKADGYYALLGYETAVQCHTIGVTGTDTSNRRIGGPGTSPDVFDTRQWYVRLSETTGLPTICVFRTQNLQSTTVDVVDTQDLFDSATSIYFTFARLQGFTINT